MRKCRGLVFRSLVRNPVSFSDGSVIDFTQPMGVVYWEYNGRVFVLNKSEIHI